jgi:hypothetical protein
MMASSIGERSGAAAILAILKQIETDLIALGGAFNQELAEAVGTIEAAFPGAWLVSLRTRRDDAEGGHQPAHQGSAKMKERQSDGSGEGGNQ